MSNIKVMLLGAFILVTQSANASDWFDWARTGEIERLKRVKVSDLNRRNEKGYTAFILATYHNHQAYALKLVEAGEDPCLPDEKGNSSLMGVIFKGHDAVAEKIMHLCDVNHQNKEGQTALMYASLFGRETVAKKLISLGARKELKDLQGRDAVSLAEGQWNQAMVSLLKTFSIIN